MKKHILLCIAAITILSVNTFAAASDNMKITLDGNPVTLDTPIVIKNSRSFVPLREIGEKILHANVGWDDKSRTAVLSKGDMTVAVKPDSDKMVVNDMYTLSIDSEGTKAFIEKGYTYLPVRVLCEVFNYDVGFSNNTIAIESNVILPQFSYMHKGDTVATIHTNYGDISLRFFPEYAPKAVENFITHAKEGYYDGVIFHRVIDNFVIQGGDPLGTGMGGESIWGEPFENEVSIDLRHFRGALCMANSGANTNKSQFYIVQCPEARADLEAMVNSDARNVQLFPDYVIEKYKEVGGYPYIDFGYTVFGQVTEGMDVVDKIASVETDESDKPIEDVIIESIEVSELTN